MNVDSLRIETERLILRPPRAQDFDAYAAKHGGCRGGTVHRWAAAAGCSHGVGFFRKAGAWAIQGFAMFSVIEKASGQWIGRLGPWHPVDWPGTEVGWGLVRAAWGKGYAYEGSVAAIDWAFDQLGWTEVIHSIAPDNKASQALARRLGSSCRGAGKLPPPHEDSPIEIWAQTREQWRRRG